MTDGTPPDVLSLVGHQKAEFRQASGLRTSILRTQLGIGVIGAATVFVTIDQVLFVAAVVGLALAGYWLWLTVRLAESRSHAERLRRATLIAGGLGMTLSGAEMFELANGGHASKAEAQSLYDPNYFASTTPPGVQRLAEMLEESAIWTANMSRIAGQEAWLVFGLSFIATMFALLGTLAFFPTNQVQIVARVFFAMLIVLLSADFFGSALSYGRSQNETARTVDRLQRLKTPTASLEEFILVFGDYNSAVEEAPVFSKGLYPRHEKRLNEQYRMFLTGPQ